MSDAKLTAEESCRQVLKTIADACDQETLARADGYIFRYVQEETVLRDCGQRGVCRTPPGCARHWEERNRELLRENEVLRSNSDHLCSENASLVSQVESMAMRIESLAEELAKPEDVRLREVLDALDGRAVIFDGMGARVTHLLDEMDEWIARAGEAERAVNRAEALLLLGPRFTDVHMEAAADFVLDELRVALRGDDNFHDYDWQDVEWSHRSQTQTTRDEMNTEELVSRLEAAVVKLEAISGKRPASGGVLFPNYGKKKSEPVAGAAIADLEYYRDGCLRTLNDPEKERFHAKERVLLAAIDAELKRQGVAPATEQAAPF